MFIGLTGIGSVFGFHGIVRLGSVCITLGVDIFLIACILFFWRLWHLYFAIHHLKFIAASEDTFSSRHVVSYTYAFFISCNISKLLGNCMILLDVIGHPTRSVNGQVCFIRFFLDGHRMIQGFRIHRKRSSINVVNNDFLCSVAKVNDAIRAMNTIHEGITGYVPMSPFAERKRKATDWSVKRIPTVRSSKVLDTLAILLVGTSCPG